jgi:hypothetical protein
MTGAHAATYLRLLAEAGLTTGVNTSMSKVVVMRPLSEFEYLLHVAVRLKHAYVLN